MSKQDTWQSLKPKAIALMEDGWSRTYAFSKLGISEHGPIYQEYFKDVEFKALCKAKYWHKTHGFYREILKVGT